MIRNVSNVKQTMFVPVQGTNSWTDIPLKRLAGAPLWWQKTSALTHFLADYNLQQLHPETPFVWDTALSGVFWRPGRKEWQAAGANLQIYFDFAKTPIDDRNLIAHSHGGQVVFYALATGLEIRNLITFGTPVRDDMVIPIEIGRKRILGTWIHVVDKTFDRIQAEGEWFDGGWQYRSEFKMADLNDKITNVEHSKLLNDPSCFHWWVDRAWTELLKGGTRQQS